MSSTTILITGANRGIGKGILSVYLSRPGTTVVAGVRDVTSVSSRSLASLPTGKGSKVVLVKINNESETLAKDAIKSLQADYGIDHLDVVVANAGIAKYYGLASITPIKELEEHLQVNAVGPLILFQATLSLLNASSSPKFIVVSSFVGSLGGMDKIPLEATAYGSSKAAVNYIVRKIHFENPNLIAFPIHPGWVQTDMGNAGAKSAGMSEAPNTLEESVGGIVSTIDNATRTATSGNFMSFDQQPLLW